MGWDVLHHDCRRPLIAGSGSSSKGGYRMKHRPFSALSAARQALAACAALLLGLTSAPQTAYGQGAVPLPLPPVNIVCPPLSQVGAVQRNAALTMPMTRNVRQRLVGMHRNNAYADPQRAHWGEAWLGGTGNWGEYDPGSLNLDTDGASIQGGFDFQFLDFTFGLAGFGQDFDAEGSLAGAPRRLDGSGYGLNAYMGYNIFEWLTFDIMGGLTESVYDVSAPGVRCTVYGLQTFVAGHLTGVFRSGNWVFSPHIGVFWSVEKQDRNTDSNGAVIPANRVSHGQFLFGGTIAYRHQVNDQILLEPYLTIDGEWDWDNGGNAQFSNGLIVDRDATGGRIELGLNAWFGRNFSAHVKGAWNSIGRSDETSWSVNGEIKYRFSYW